MATTVFIANNYTLAKSEMTKKHPFQGVRGRIIERELAPLVEGKCMTGLKLESAPALHVLRINFDKRIDVVLYMAKESLLAIERMTSWKEDGKEKSEHGIIAFREGVECARQPSIESHEFHHLNIYDLENGIPVHDSSLLKELEHFGYGFTTVGYPSWHEEDWFQIRSDHGLATTDLYFRMDVDSLYGVGFCKQARSSLVPVKDGDVIFYWNTPDVMRGYYKRALDCEGHYLVWPLAKLKVSETKEE